MTSGLSFHVLYDAIDHDPNPLRVAIASLRPRVINIVGGARKTQAFSFALELHNKYKDMRVIFRNWPDDGNHAKDKYKLAYHRDAFGNLIVDDESGCQRWIADNRVYLEAGLTVLTDNESIRDDLDVYGEWQSRVMDLAGAKGWKVAVGRFATGNPPKEKLAQLNQMWRTLFKWGDLHCFSPNEYMSRNPTRNGGNVYRYIDAIDHAKKIGAWPFPVNIGEFGLLYMEDSGRLDPEAGYKDNRVGLGGAASARFCINQWRQWYQQEGVDACFYCWSGDGSNKWERCRIDNDDGFIRELLDANTKGELEVVATTKINTVPAPANKGEAITIVITGTSKWNLRSEPDVVNGLWVGQVKPGDTLKLYMSTIHPNGGLNWYFVERENAAEGESKQGWMVYTLPVTQPPPVVIPPPTLPVTVSEHAALYAYHLKRSQAEYELAMWHKEQMDNEQTSQRAA